MMVDVSTVVSDHVMKKLEDSFGKAVALMIFASATRAADVPTGELNAGEYHRLIAAICSDERCVGMWGEAGADQVRQQWEVLV